MAEVQTAGVKETVVGNSPLFTENPAENSGVASSSSTTSYKAVDGTQQKPVQNRATISQKLAKVFPSQYPLDTILRNIPSGTTKSDLYEFPSVYARGIKAKVKTQNTAETDSPVEIEVINCECLSKDGDLLVPTYKVVDHTASAVSSGVAFRPLVIHIVDINYATKKITCIGVNAPIPALSADTILLRMASAKDQEAAMSNDPMSNPKKDSNYCQRNMVTISENKFQQMQEKDFEYGMAQLKETALLDFRYQQEMSSVFGATYYKDNNELIDPISQKRKLHLRGILDFPIQQLTYSKSSGVALDEAINGFMEKLFTGNNGSEKRLLIYGPGFGTQIANSKIWEKQLAAAETEVVLGVTWNKIVTNNGTLLAIPHQSFGLLGEYSNMALVLDPANIRRIDQKPLTENKLDLVKAGIRNSDDVTLEESWTIEVTNPQTHGVIYLGA